jgi:anti-sigma factor NepR-like protein
MKTRKTVDAESAASDADMPEPRDAMGRPVTPRKTEMRLGREAQARIGQQLRAMYESVVNEGVPAHIADLVRRLSDQDEGAA